MVDLEIRKPKAGTRKRSEIRIPNQSHAAGQRWIFGFRSSVFGFLSEFGFRVSVFGVIVPVTNRSKYSSNTLVVIQIPASQGQAADPQHFILP